MGKIIQKCSEVKRSKVRWGEGEAKRSEVKWSEVKWGEVKVKWGEGEGEVKWRGNEVNCGEDVKGT
jgi:hypothetical protein